jgi:hypothetical protein
MKYMMMYPFPTGREMDVEMKESEEKRREEKRTNEMK